MSNSSKEEQLLLAKMIKFSSRLFLCWTLNFAVVFLAFIKFLLLARLDVYFYIYLGAGIILNLVMFPRVSWIEEPARTSE